MHNAEHTKVLRPRTLLYKLHFPAEYLLSFLENNYFTHLTLEWGCDGDRASYRRPDGALRRGFFRHCDPNRGSLGTLDHIAIMSNTKELNRHEGCHSE